MKRFPLFGLLSLVALSLIVLPIGRAAERFQAGVGAAAAVEGPVDADGESRTPPVTAHATQANAGWEEVGAGSASGGGISNNAGGSQYPAVAVAPDGTPYVAWDDCCFGAGPEIYMLRWNGNSWEEVGTGSASGGGISNSGQLAVYPSLAIAPDGILYVAWEFTPAETEAAEIYALRRNGSTWDELGGSASGGGVSDDASLSAHPSIAIAPDGTPYVAWEDHGTAWGNEDMEIYVKRWNGSSWVAVGTGSASGGGISDNDSSSTSQSFAIAPDGTLYIAWQDNGGGDDEIYVRRWNGSTWDVVGAGSASGGGISDNDGQSRVPSIAVAPDGTPYVAWEDDSSGVRQIYVRYWDGSSWEQVGTGSAIGSGISNHAFWSSSPWISIAPDGKPYVTWVGSDLQDSEIYVRRWNGSVWEEIETGSASGSGISDNSGYSLSPAMAIGPDGSPYVTWYDSSGGNDEIYVRRRVLLVAPTLLDFGTTLTELTLLVNPTNLLDSWSLSESVPWLSLDQASGVGNAIVTASVDRDGLASGEYDGTINAEVGNYQAEVTARIKVITDETLAQKFAPYVCFHQDEDFSPNVMDVMLENAWLRRRTMYLDIENIAKDPNEKHLFDNPEANNFLDLHYCSDWQGNDWWCDFEANHVNRYNNWCASNGCGALVYARVDRNTANAIVIQYWLFYYYNNHPLWNHEGDWEMVQVVLDPDGTPQYAGFSQHNGGSRRLWANVETRNEVSGVHPIVYVARGSHASYFTDDYYGFDVTGASDCVLPSVELIKEPDTNKDYSELVFPEVAWLRFRGSWGEQLQASPSAPAARDPQWTDPIAWMDDLGWDVSKYDSIFVSPPGDVSYWDPFGPVHDLSPRVYTRDGLIEYVENCEVTDGGMRYLIPHKDAEILIGYVLFTARPGCGAATPLSSGLLSSFGITASLLYSPTNEVITYTLAGISLGPDGEGRLDWSGGNLALLLDTDGNGDVDQIEQAIEVGRAHVNLDTTPPAQVMDLAVQGVPGGAVLAWTAPGDDAYSGTALLYDLRYSTEPLMESNWGEANRANEPLPAPAGTIERVDIRGLAPGQMAFWGLVTYDERWNKSSLSNIVSVKIPYGIYMPMVLRNQ